MPQASTRDILDNNAVCIVLKETEIEHFLKNSCIKPSLVVTDSQAFGYVKSVIPEDIPLTSFSIVFSRIKGDFENYIKGTKTIDELQDGDKILILESCTHHVSCDDRQVKSLCGFSKILKEAILPCIRSYDLSDKIKDYKLVIQCGGCMRPASRYLIG